MTGGPHSRTARTRERILTAAIDLFLENGFHGTNIDSVASQSRSSKQTIYKYYDDKEEILEHAIARLKEELREETLRINFDSADFKTELMQFGLQYLESILKERQVKTFRLCVEMARKKPSIDVPFGHVDSENLHTVLAKYISHLGANGLIEDAEDSEFMAQAFLGMVRGNYHFFRTVDEDYEPSRQELRDHVERVTVLFCTALQCKT